MSLTGMMETQIVLVRHGETEWSRTGQHTGRTDIPLTERGRSEASLVGPTLAEWDFAGRFSSPLQRALETATLSGVPGEFTIVNDLIEWDYGIYEGRRNDEIIADEPGWSKWNQPLKDGESVAEVGARADRAIVQMVAAAADGPVIAFAHGHLLAVLIARWLGLDAVEGRRFVLETGTATVLGVKRSDRVLRVFNQRCGISHIDT